LDRLSREEKERYRDMKEKMKFKVESGKAK
jgi:hypothetical protein